MKRIISIALIFALVSPAFSHELTINAKDNTMKAGEPFPARVQSAHKFIVPEEVEVLERVKAGIIEDGKLVVDRQRSGAVDRFHSNTKRHVRFSYARSH